MWLVSQSDAVVVPSVLTKATIFALFDSIEQEVSILKYYHGDRVTSIIGDGGG